MRNYNISKITLVVCLLFFSYFLFAQCPKGIPNCKGQCPRFLDNNNDGFCDLTTVTEIVLLQLDVNKNKKDTTINKTIKKDTIKVTTNVINKQKHNNKETNQNIKSDTGKGNTTVSNSVTNNPGNQQNNTTIKEVKPPKQQYNTYDLVLVSSLTFGLYFLTFSLAKFRKIKTKTHRKIWNILLLLTFIVSCLFGFFLVLQINYKFLFSIFRTLLYWHVEIGIAMTLIAVFHILWHLKYFKTIIKAMKHSENK